MKIYRNLHIHIYLKTFVLGAKYNEKSFEKGPGTLPSLLYVTSNTIKSIDDENIFKIIYMGISPTGILCLTKTKICNLMLNIKYNLYILMERVW